MRRRYLSLCMSIALALTSVFPYGAAAEEAPAPVVEAAEGAEAADLSANALDETEAPAAEASTGEDVESQGQEEAQESVSAEGAQAAAEEQVPMSAENAQVSEPAQIALPEEGFDEEEAIVADAEELSHAEATENADAKDADVQDAANGENAPFDPAAINLADSQISVEAASIEADPMLAEEEGAQPNYRFTSNETKVAADGYVQIYRGMESYTFTLEAGDGQSLEGKTIDWNFGVWTEDESQNRELDEQFEGLYTCEGNSITIQPRYIPMEEPLFKEKDGSYSFQIQALISENGQEESAILWVNVQWDDNYNYYFTGDDDFAYRPADENGKDYTTIYTDAEKYTFCLSSVFDDPYAGRDVNWDLGFWDENGDFTDLKEALADACVINEEQKTVTVYPAKIPLEAITRTDEEGNEMTAFQICAGIIPEEERDNEVASATLWINVAEAGYDENALPGEDTKVVLGDEFYIQAGYDMNVWDAESPDGKAFWYEVTGVEVTYPDGNANVLSYCLEEDRWIDAAEATIEKGDCGLRADNLGTADVKLTLSCEEREDIVYSFEISVVGELYNLDIPYPSNGFQMAFGGELTIPTSLTYRKYDINYNEPAEEPVTDYELEVTGCEWGEEYFAVESDGQEIKVTCRPCEDEQVENAGLKFFVAAKVDGEIVTENEVYVNAYRGYFELEPESAENIELPLGETYEIEPKLIYYQDGEPIDLTGEAEFFVSYVDVGEDGVPFGDLGEEGRLYAAENGKISLTRQTPAWGTVCLFVRYEPNEEEGIGYPLNPDGNDGPKQFFNFCGLDYSDFGIEDAEMDRTLFTGEGEELTLRAKNVPEGEGYQVKWEYLRYPKGDGEPEDVSSAVEAVQNGNSVTLTTTGEQFREENNYFNVKAVLYYGDPENGIELTQGEREVFVSVEEPKSCLVYAEDPNGDTNIMLNERIPFPYDKELGGYTGQVFVRNSRYPDGALIPVLLSGFKLEQEDPDVTAAELIEPTDEDNCYYIHALEEGSAVLTFVVSQANGQEFDEAWKTYGTLHLNVLSESPEYMRIGDVWTEGTKASGYLLPEDEAQIVFSVVHIYYDQELGEWQSESFRSNELPDDYKLEISYEVRDEGQDLFTVDENGVIVPNGGRGYADVVLNAFVRRGEEEFPLAEENECTIGIQVTGIYYGLQLDNPLYVEPGAEISIPEKVTEYSVTSPEGKEGSAEVKWTIEGYDDGLLAAGEDGTILQIKEISQDEQPLSTAVYFSIRDLRGDEYWYRQELVICQHKLQEEVTKAPTCVDTGIKTITCGKCGYTKTEEIPATGVHSWSEWKTVSPATTEAPERQQRTCTVCGTATEERTVGEKLQPSTGAPSTEAPSTPSTETPGAQTPAAETPGAGAGTTGTGAVQAPFIELNATSIPLKLKQSTGVIKVKMAEGDSIVSWTSSNKKIVTVNGKGKLKAKKKGKATITVTLASGKTASFVVTVQKNKVTTKKVSGVEKKLTLAKGKKYKLEPVLKPLTSQDKITYTSSNKKVAVVDKKGNITAKGKGTAKITVKSGKKKAVCTVTVK